MYAKKNPESYCLFKKQIPSGKVWYVKFSDNQRHHYGLIKSTGISVESKRERRRETENAAQKLISSFIEKKTSMEIMGS